MKLFIAIFDLELTIINILLVLCIFCAVHSENMGHMTNICQQKLLKRGCRVATYGLHLHLMTFPVMYFLLVI